MKLLERTLFIVILVISSSPAQSEPELYTDPVGTVTGGQNCFPVNEDQAKYFERREDGIWNVSTDKTLW